MNESNDTIDSKFVEQVEQIKRQQQLLTDIIEQATVVNKTELTDEDFTRLLYGRLNVPLSDIEEVLDSVDTISQLSPQEAATRLISQSTKMSMRDVEEVLDEANRISEKYGDDAE